MLFESYANELKELQTILAGGNVLIEYEKKRCEDAVKIESLEKKIKFLKNELEDKRQTAGDSLQKKRKSDSKESSRENKRPNNRECQTGKTNVTVDVQTGGLLPACQVIPPTPRLSAHCSASCQTSSKKTETSPGLPSLSARPTVILRTATLSPAPLQDSPCQPGLSAVSLGKS